MNRKYRGLDPAAHGAATVRRRLLGGLLAMASMGAAPLAFARRGSGAAAPGAATSVEMWKNAGCGCCKDWVAHLEAEGFSVRSYDSGNAAVRAKLGMPERYGSCHTALVDGYVLEGHVPAREIRRLLAQRPAALGLAVPQMPIGSPGMDGPVYGGRRDPYDVLLVARDGRASVYQAYR